MLDRLSYKLKKNVNKQTQTVLNANKVAAGEGYMQNGRYVAYTPSEREHVQGAEANKSATYTDTATNSALGTYQKTEQQQEVVNPAVQETVLGGAGNVKTKKRKLGSASVLGGGSVLGG